MPSIAASSFRPSSESHSSPFVVPSPTAPPTRARTSSALVQRVNLPPCPRASYLAGVKGPRGVTGWTWVRGERMLNTDKRNVRDSTSARGA
jgi:hypothetical protein